MSSVIVIFVLSSYCCFISADCRFFVIFAFNFQNISVPAFIALFTGKDYTIMHHDGALKVSSFSFWHYYIINYYLLIYITTKIDHYFL